MREPSNYRPDIDGLRAIAVLAVVVFHLDADFLPGGFAGVDIFFVISGFLITGIIVRQIQQGTFSFREFYRRRIKRIVPVLATVILTTLAVGQFVLLPDDLERLSISGITSQLFVGNVYFTYFLDTSYFADDAGLEPLLHLWSLGVEEQFYLLWPATLLGVFTIGRYRLVAGFSLLIGLASFLLPVILPSLDRMFLYYMLPARAGELLTGALCFIVTSRTKQPSTAAAAIFATAGAVMVGLSLVYLSDDTIFPGLAALPVSIGSASLIYAGTRKNPVSLALSTRVAVWIGLASYSIYLWHWPVLAYVKYLIVEVGLLAGVLSLVLIAVLSFFSYRFVEHPFRTSQLPFREVFVRYLVRPTLVIVGLAGMFVVTAGFGLFALSDDYRAELGRSESSNIRPSDDPHICQQISLTASDLTDSNCVIGNDSEPAILLWGDSNASHFVGTFSVLAEHYGFSFRNFAHAACPPVLDEPEVFTSNRFHETCHDSAELVRSRLDGYRVIILGASWDVYLHRGREEFERALAATIQRFTQSGKKVVILGVIPTVASFDRDCRQKAIKVPFLQCDARTPTPKSDTERYNSRVRSIAESNGAFYVELNDELCPNGLCNGYVGNEQVYYDHAHLSLSGSETLGRVIVESDVARALVGFLAPASSASRPR